MATLADRTGSHPAPKREQVSLLALWIGLLAAPLGWSLLVMLGFALSAHACFPRDVPLASPIWQSIWLFLLAIVLIAAFVGIVGDLVAFRSWRRTRDEKPGRADRLLASGEGRTRFLAMSGLLVSTLFILAVGFEAIALFLSPLCEG
jgi:hypothetical protein